MYGVRGFVSAPLFLPILCVGFDSGRAVQVADFSRCRLLFERVDLRQNCHMLCYRKYRVKISFLIFQNHKTGRIADYTYLLHKIKAFKVY
jgi:hypothetical protein